MDAFVNRGISSSRLEEGAVTLFAGECVALENYQLLLVLLVHDQVFAVHDGDKVLALRFLDANDLNAFPGISLCHRNVSVSHDLISFILDPEELIDIGDQQQVKPLNFDSFAALEILVDALDPDIVHILPLIDIEADLVGFEGHRV
jgi:hypothetical protein